jgi:hypothetical protein
MQKRRIFLYIAVVLLLLVLHSCAGTGLRTASLADNERITGIFTVILYGTQEYESLNTIAFLDIEGDGYELNPSAPESNYTVIKNIQDQEAVEKALHFISTQNPDFRNAQTRRILDERGNTIGYELRPLYRKIVYGLSDVLRVHYSPMERGKVKVSISLYEQIKTRLNPPYL